MMAAIVLLRLARLPVERRNAGERWLLARWSETWMSSTIYGRGFQVRKVGGFGWPQAQKAETKP